MKDMKRRLVALTAAGVLMAGLLAGCAPKESATPTPTPTASPSEAVPPTPPPHPRIGGKDQGERGHAQRTYRYGSGQADGGF